MEAWEAFFHAARRARGRASQSPEEGLSLSQFHLLEPLASGPERVRTLAEAAGVAPPTATRMLDCLARDGLVTRRPDPGDRRVVLISLTPEGRRSYARKRRAVTATRRRIAESLAPEERERAAALLSRLAQAIERL